MVIRYAMGCCAGMLLGVACGRVPEMIGPEYAIEESRIVTSAGTEHIQVFVPAGAFKMGAADGEAHEQPVHEVDLDAFYIDKHPVTNAQYRAFMAATGSFPPTFMEIESFNQPQQPVVSVPWSMARDYCMWAGMQLPTEAQWEKAAGGTDGRFYPWGNEAPDAARANFDFQMDRPLPVGSHPDGASPYGAHDMAGNVWEWVLDEYSPTFYAHSPRKNPVNLFDGSIEAGPDRSLRGGGWFSPGWDLRVSGRTSTYLLFQMAETLEGIESTTIDAAIGFRCVRPMTEKSVSGS